MDTLKVKVILGSIRKGRFSEHSAQWMMGILKENSAIEAELVDLAALNLPLYEGPTPPSMAKQTYDNASVQEWSKKISEADAYIFVTPEYNRSISGVLKDAIDHLYPEWNQKVFGIVTHGSVGGARAAEQLRTIGIELQMASVRQGVHIMAPWMMTDEKGLKAGALDTYKHSADTMVGQLSWWGNALKVARAAK